MARKLIKQAKNPFEIKSQKESVRICMCGLSKNQPFCDGSHEATETEKDDKIYEYDKEGRRTELK